MAHLSSDRKAKTKGFAPRQESDDELMLDAAPLFKAPKLDLSPPVFRSISAPSYFGSEEPSALKFELAHAGTPITRSLQLAPPKESLSLSLTSTGKESLTEAHKRADVPPPVPGGYLEPSYHLIFTCAPPRVLDAIRQSFSEFEKERGVSIEIKAMTTPFRLDCAAYPVDASSVTYIVRVFSHKHAGESCYAVEFQRRSGDLVLFSDLWSTVRQQLSSRGLLKSPVDAPPARPAPPKLERVEITADQMKSSVDCLAQMAASEFEDVKLQALSALCRMSTDGSKKQCLAENSACLDALVSTLGVFGEDADRCAFTTLANLLCQGVAQYLHEKRVLEKAVDVLKSTPSKHVTVQGAAFLCNLQQHCPKRGAECLCVGDLARSLQSSPDAAVRDNGIRLATAYAR